MSGANGFIKMRRGLEEHLVSGRIGLFEAGIYLVVHFQANYRTGIWVGSAPRLLATAPCGTSLRAIQRALERLEEIVFLKSFHTQGARGNYRVLINKFEPSFGALKGKRLNAEQSTDWRNPVYEFVAEDDAVPDAEHDAESDTEDAPYQEVEVGSRGRSRRKPSASASPPQVAQTPATPPIEQKAESKPSANPALIESKEYAFKDFERIHGQPPTWDASDFTALAKLFHDKPKLTSLEFHRRWLNFSSSTDSFETKQGMRLRYFCANFDKFLGGPIYGGNNGSNGNGSKKHSGAVPAPIGKYAGRSPASL